MTTEQGFFNYRLTLLENLPIIVETRTSILSKRKGEGSDHSI